MRPDTPQQLYPDSRGSVPSVARDTTRQTTAVANMTRQQIDAIYGSQDLSSIPTAAATTQHSTTNQHSPSVQENLKTELPEAYQKTHEPAHSIDSKQWEHYHSQWQKYYQQYYEQYYVGAVKQTHDAYKEHATKLHAELERQKAEKPQEMTQSEAMTDLRSQLLSKVQHNAKKVKKSRHFVPAISAAVVMLVFLFLQYNSTLLAYANAYISPGNVDPQNIIVDPNASLAVPPEPKLVIPKINVDIPVDYNAKPDYDSQMAAMESSVAYFGIPGANSKPGQLGNTPLAGHSSNDFTDSGAAKFIFARLEQLQKGDVFYLNYNGTRHTYSITEMRIVLPTEVTQLQLGNDKPYATLITCTPLGTAEKRLLVIAEQISPSPSSAATPAASDATTTAPKMAGKSPTLVERLFGAR